MEISEEQRNSLQEQLREAIENTDLDGGVALASQALDSGMTPVDFFQQVIEPVLKAIGDAFARLEVFLPDLMRAGAVVKAMQQQVLEPAIRQAGGDSQSAGVIVIGTCQGDIHDIGKNMVALMLQVNGFEVIDMGVDVPPRKVLEKAQETGAEIVGLSSLMTTSMPYMKEAVELRDGLGLKGRFAVIVGGAPITPEYSRQIGADAFGQDAVDGVQKCLELMAQRG